MRLIVWILEVLGDLLIWLADKAMEFLDLFGGKGR